MALETGKQKICGVLINCLGADATVNLYDASGVVIDQRFFGVHQQPGISKFYPLYFLIRNGGYVEISGTAEVFVYLT